VRKDAEGVRKDAEGVRKDAEGVRKDAEGVSKDAAKEKHNKERPGPAAEGCLEFLLLQLEEVSCDLEAGRTALCHRAPARRVLCCLLGHHYI
jgi:hypothetical protein